MGTKAYIKTEVAEQVLEDLVRQHAGLIEEGLVYLDHQKQTTRGRLDMLLLDSGNALVVAELKVVQDDGMPVPPDEQIEADARLGEQDDAQMVGRDARFRIEVVAAYDYTCALTGHRLLTIDAGSVVEAAHIHPFSDSRNNDPRNGLALTRNMHWAFDEGLWSVADEGWRGSGMERAMSAVAQMRPPFWQRAIRPARLDAISKMAIDEHKWTPSENSQVICVYLCSSVAISFFAIAFSAPSQRS